MIPAKTLCNCTRPPRSRKAGPSLTEGVGSTPDYMNRTLHHALQRDMKQGASVLMSSQNWTPRTSSGVSSSCWQTHAVLVALAMGTCGVSRLVCAHVRTKKRVQSKLSGARRRIENKCTPVPAEQKSKHRTNMILLFEEGGRVTISN